MAEQVPLVIERKDVFSEVEQTNSEIDQMVMNCLKVNVKHEEWEGNAHEKMYNHLAYFHWLMRWGLDVWAA